MQKIKHSSKLQSILEPRPPLTISQWSERYRVLGSPSEERGPLKLSRTPYAKPILDALSPDSQFERVVLAKSAQVAGTEIAVSVAGFYTCYDPSPVMMVLADEETAKYMMSERLTKMFENSKHLKKLVNWDTTTQRDVRFFPGSYLTIGWASSVARLASRPIRVVILDEVDKPGYYVSTREASAVSLAAERTATFFNRKILILSTPTDEEGNIWVEMSGCEVVFDWHVPCPKCGLFQPLRWSDEYQNGFQDGVFRTEDGTVEKIGSVFCEDWEKPSGDLIEKSGYQCGRCGDIWTTQQKNFAVAHGKSVPRTKTTGREKSAGFHVNRLYSLLGSSGDIPKLVKNYIETRDNPDKYQGFVNSTLGEPFARTETKIDANRIEYAETDYQAGVVPEAARALVAFVDVHKTNFWYAIRAFAPDFTSWLIEWGQVIGDFENLDSILFDRSWPVSGGNSLPLWKIGIDIGGGRYSGESRSSTEQTYLWALKNRGRRPPIFLMKGASKAMATKVAVGKPIEKLPSGQPLQHGLRVVTVDTHGFKDLFHFRLQNAMEQTSEAAYLPKNTDKNYIKQILAEEKRWNRRKKTYEWVAISRENHLLDCEVGCHALVDPEFPGGGVNIFATKVANPQQKLQNTVDKQHRNVRKNNRISPW